MCRCFWKMTEDGSLTYYNRVFGGQAELMHINATSHTSSGQQQQHHKDHDHNHTEVHKEGFGRDLREWGEHEDARAGAKGTPTNFLICILSTENTSRTRDTIRRASSSCCYTFNTARRARYAIAILLKWQCSKEGSDPSRSGVAFLLTQPTSTRCHHLLQSQCEHPPLPPPTHLPFLLPCICHLQKMRNMTVVVFLTFSCSCSPNNGEPGPYSHVFGIGHLPLPKIKNTCFWCLVASFLFQ